LRYKQNHPSSNMAPSVHQLYSHGVRLPLSSRRTIRLPRAVLEFAVSM